MSSTEHNTIVAGVATAVAVAATLRLVYHPLSKTLASAYVQWLDKKSRKDEGTVVGSVSQLYIHPVKSLRAVPVEEIKLDEKGCEGDRRFMVVYQLPLPVFKEKFDEDDTSHRCLTQRQCPSLALTTAKIGKDALVLEYGKKSIKVSLDFFPSPPRMIKAGIWSDVCSVQDMGDDAAKFFQDIIDADEEASGAGGMFKKVRLVAQVLDDRRASPSFMPPAATSWTGNSPLVPLADEYPVLLGCESSLDNLNRKLVEKGVSAVPMKQFRPNVVIKGTEAFDEDTWKYVVIGEQKFAVVKACPRCKLSCTDQDTGKASSEPMATMKSFRALGSANEDVFFAQNAVPLGKAGRIRVGDTVRVLKRGDPVYES